MDFIQQLSYRQIYSSLVVMLLLMVSAGSLALADESVSVPAPLSQWRAHRLESLTSPTGWLTLEGLFWLKPGSNVFGSGASASLKLLHPKLPPVAGEFILNGSQVDFAAARSVAVMSNGVRVSKISLKADTSGEPTVLSIGTLDFFVIERGDRFGIRVRDRESSRRRDFAGLQYFPARDEWFVDARFEAYSPARTIPIVNILGMEVPMTSPGAVVFEKDGQQWRLDTVLEESDSPELFIMFADATSGRETYGGGRFLTAQLPKDGHVQLDFNRAYNPPCAFNNFATCPLPPSQNRLSLPVRAGELKYAHSGG